MVYYRSSSQVYRSPVFFVIAVCSITLSTVVAPAAADPLRFGDDGLFTAMQIADLHYGEAPSLSWGPEQDRNSTRVMNAVFTAEAPQLVVFSGDQITGNNVVDNATDVLAEVYSEVVRHNLTFCAIYGNHDDAPLDKIISGVNRRRLSITTRRQLLSFERTRYTLQSITCTEGSAGGPLPCPTDLAPSVTNYYHLVVDSTSTPRAVFYFLDSGGGSYDEELYPLTTNWLASTAAVLTTQFGRLPSLTFVHIPPPEYSGVYPGAPGACVGMADDGITPTTGPNNLASVLRATGASRAVFVGHDHGNAWCCTSPDTGHMCYGRHSGYGGYGDWARGARVIQLSLNASARDGIGVQSWIRMEDGSVEQRQWM